MTRTMIPALFVTLVCSLPAAAQDWAAKMFSVTSHDFGAVARESKTEFEFKLKNIYLQDVRIAGVRSSCGCTQPSIKKALLKTYEEGAIVAKVNTVAFRGQKGATLTVTIDKPFFAEVQLHVRSYICDDVILQPESVQLGSVKQGTAVEREVRVSAGNLGLVEARSANPHLQAKLLPEGAYNGQAVYRVQVRLTEGAPAGYLRDHVMLVTSDPYRPQVAVPVEGVVLPAISVSPSSLFLGEIPAGQKVVKQLVVRGDKPFRITQVRTADAHFRVETIAASAPRDVYLIPVTFIAGDKPERISETIRIETDLENMIAELPATVEVTRP